MVQCTTGEQAPTSSEASRTKVQIMVQPVNPDIKRASVDTARAELEGTQSHPDEATDSPGEGSQQGAVREIGGPGGPEPTRYGDWERNGRCIDF